MGTVLPEQWWRIWRFQRSRFPYFVCHPKRIHAGRYTLSALQLLAMCDALDRIDSLKVLAYVFSLFPISRFLLPLLNEDGSVKGDQYGELDCRFNYCFVQSLYLLRLPKAPTDYFDKDRISTYISKCQNIDGRMNWSPSIIILRVRKHHRIRKSCWNVLCVHCYTVHSQHFKLCQFRPIRYEVEYNSFRR